MIVKAREATPKDLGTLLGLYQGLQKEMDAYHPMWSKADGLKEPIESSLRDLLEDQSTVVSIGEIDNYPFGFMVARVEELLPQAAGQSVGSIRLVYVEQAAREVSVGETMLNFVMDKLRQRGVTLFDAHVLPGHRLVKNFFESGGFSARSIVMHHDDSK